MASQVLQEQGRYLYIVARRLYNSCVPHAKAQPTHTPFAMEVEAAATKRHCLSGGNVRALREHWHALNVPTKSMRCEQTTSSKFPTPPAQTSASWSWEQPSWSGS